ncbi:MAG: hypothetical protein IKH04_03490 [Kiritimatiellae bacterium]|nr:hypothetical protein [Kiritimatiellia bacterium]
MGMIVKLIDWLFARNKQSHQERVGKHGDQIVKENLHKDCLPRIVGTKQVVKVQENVPNKHIARHNKQGGGERKQANGECKRGKGKIHKDEWEDYAWRKLVEAELSLVEEKKRWKEVETSMETLSPNYRSKLKDTASISRPQHETTNKNANSNQADIDKMGQQFCEALFMFPHRKMEAEMKKFDEIIINAAKSGKGLTQEDIQALKQIDLSDYRRWCERYKF